MNFMLTRPSHRQGKVVAAYIDMVAIFLLAESFDQVQQRLFAVELRLGRAVGQQRIDCIGAGVDAQQELFV